MTPRGKKRLLASRRCVIAEWIFGQFCRYRKVDGLHGGQNRRFLLYPTRPVAATEMYRQGSGLVESIDGPFAANDSPIVATAPTIGTIFTSGQTSGYYTPFQEDT